MRRLMGIRGERGVSAVLVVISLTAIFGAAILSVDAGQLWTARRNVVTGTDAAALAQGNAFAKFVATGGTIAAGTQCDSTVWLAKLNQNVAGTFGNQCTVNPNPLNSGRSGAVIVQSRKLSPARFAGVLGLGDSAAFSMTAVKWGFVQPTGLRPIALCINDPHILDGVGTTLIPPVASTHTAGSPPEDYFAPDGTTDLAGHTPGVVHHLAFTDQNPLCGVTGTNGAGNFGFIDLNFNQGDQDFQTKDLNDWLVNGYYGNHVSLTPTPDCDLETPGANGCNGKTGTVGGTDPGMCFLVYQNTKCTGSKDPLTVLIILYSAPVPCDLACGGSNATFVLRALAHVKVWDYGLSNADRFLDLQFVATTTEGICCDALGPAGGGPPVVGSRICDVDHHGDPNLALACL